MVVCFFFPVDAKTFSHVLIFLETFSLRIMADAESSFFIQFSFELMKWSRAVTARPFDEPREMIRVVAKLITTDWQKKNLFCYNFNLKKNFV